MQNSDFNSMFKHVALFFSAWFIICASVSVLALGGVFCALYWALTIAERAVGG